MSFFFSFLLTFCLLYFSGSLRASPAQDDHDTRVEAVDRANARTWKDLWTFLTSPSYIMKKIKRAVLVGLFLIIFSPPTAVACVPSTLLFSSAVEAFMAPQSSPSTFWERAKEYDEILHRYVPRLLKKAGEYFKSTSFTDITRAMKEIVRATAAFRNSIQEALDTRRVTLDALSEELDAIFTKIVHSENFPSLNKAPGHAERGEMVNKVLNDTEIALMDLAKRYGIEEEVVTRYLRTLRPHVHALTVAVGDTNEQYPQLFPALAFSVSSLLVPESWILRPLLGVFGFGPAGPVKGSIAARVQSRFWGGAVKAGSWFALLQAVGMGATPKWTGVVTQVLFGGIRGLWAFILRRRERPNGA